MKMLSRLSLIIGILLLAINSAGFFIPLRSPDITPDYADFARDGTPPYHDTLSKLDELSNRANATLEYFNEATKIFHYGIAHIAPEDVKENGLDHYRMRVPIWENYILYALSYLDPKTFLDYEFCSYKKALNRGTGRCGQQAMALADYLDGNGIHTGYVALGGHALAAAKTSDGQWVMLDPDYGGVIPLELAQAEANPESVIPYYWNQSLIIRTGLFQLFGPEKNEFRDAPPESRQPNTCLMESISYVAKWLIPFVLLGFGALLTRKN